jgi:hypothetical protein
MFNLIPNYSKYSLLFEIKSQSYQDLTQTNKKRFMHSIISLNDIDDRFIIDENTIFVNKEIGDSNNNNANSQQVPRKENSNYFYNYRYKQQQQDSNYNVQRNLENNNEFGNNFMSGSSSVNRRLNYQQPSQNYYNSFGNSEATSPFLQDLMPYELFRFKEKSSNINSADYFFPEAIKNSTTSNKINKDNIDIKTMKTHPCFNIGYYNKDLNFTGSGNYTLCYNLLKEDYFSNPKNISDDLVNIKEISSEENNKTLLEQTQVLNKSNLIISEKNITIGKNSTITKHTRSFLLDNQFKLFKFLFYEKNSENVYRYKEKLQYSQILKKVEHICSKQYSYLIAEMSRFAIRNLYKICFDLTYFILAFDNSKYTIQKEDFLILPAHLNKAQNYSNGFRSPYTILQVLMDKKNLGILITFLISLIMSIVFFLISEKLINSLTRKIFKQETPHSLYVNEKNLDEFLSFPKVKYFLFHNSQSYFKKKYGVEFDLENYDYILIKNEIRDLIDGIHSEQLSLDEINENNETLFHFKELIIESKKYVNELKVCLAVHLVHIVFIIILVISFCLILHIIKVEYGLLRAITTVVALLFICFVMIICFKMILKFEKNKKEIQKEKERDDLMVVEKIVIEG